MGSSAQKKGYLFAMADGSNFYIPDALHVERDDELFIFGDDAEAAKAAEQDGIRLIYGMEDVPDGVYVDTPENRAAILESLEKYPEYRSVVTEGHIPDIPETGMNFTQS